MNTKNCSIHDMTEYGPIYDRDGYANYFLNFRKVMEALADKRPLVLKSQKVTVLISIIKRYGESVVRCDMEKTYTYGHLFRLYEKMLGKNLPEVTEERTLESFEKEGEKRGAWGLYAYTSHQQQLVQAEQVFEKSIASLSEDEKGEKRQLFKKDNSCMIRIVG